MEYKRQTFENFLREIHAQLYTRLDDDMSDDFNNWLGELDGDDYMRYAENYGEYEYLQGTQNGLTKAADIIKGNE